MKILWIFIILAVICALCSDKIDKEAKADKKLKRIIIVISVLVLLASTIGIALIYRTSEAYRKAKSAIQWDCSVACAEASNPDKYVITYSDVKVLSPTGVFTVQNRNDFDIKVYLLCAEETVRESETIPAGGCYSFMNVSSKEYTVGIHADVDMNTEIKVFVYDGKDTEPYTK